MQSKNNHRVVNRLREMIKRRELDAGVDLTYSDLSAATGLSISTISNWVNQRVARYDAHVLVALCLFFDCQPGDLLQVVPVEVEARSAGGKLAGPFTPEGYQGIHVPGEPALAPGILELRG